MSSLVVGGVPIKVAVSSPRWTRMDAVDRARAFDNTFRASQTGGAVRTWDFETPAVLAATEGETYKAALSTVASQLCSGDIIAIPTMCSAELTDGVPTRVGGQTHVVLSFSLHEVQPAKTLLRYAPGDTIAGETFTRSTTARYSSSAGVVTSAAINVKRDSHYIAGVRSLLLEATRTNRCLQSEDFGTTWSVSGTPTRTPAAHTASGISLDLLGDDSGAAIEHYSRLVAFVGDGTKAVSIYVKKGTAPAAGGSVVKIFDNTALNTLMLATVTFDGAGVPIVVMSAGTYHSYEPLAGGVYRLLFSVPSVTAANLNEVDVHPAGVSAEQGDIYMGGVQCEDGTYPTSYIPTTTVAVTRGADLYSIPFTTPPQEMSVYSKFVEKGSSNAGARAFQVSNAADAGPALRCYASGTFYTIQHENAVNVITSSLAVAPVLADTVELLARLFGTGDVDISQSLNSGAATTSAQPGGNTLASAWSGPLVWLNSGGSAAGIGFTAIQSFKIVAGARSLAEMRAL